jgi:competence protein ComFB
MIKNLVEEHVREAFDALRQHHPTFCACGGDLCREDVMVFALNRLPPRYVASLEGHVVTELSLESDQKRAEIEVVVMEAFRKISMAPRCPKFRRLAAGDP